MSSNLNVTNNPKKNIEFTTTSNNLVRPDSDAINFKSKPMRSIQNRIRSQSFNNFDDLEAEYNDEYKEIKDYFIMKPIANYKLYDTICISNLSELNREYDDAVKTKLYSAVILDNKSKIIEIKNNKIMFENTYKANNIQSVMEHTLHTLCDELLYLTENFEKDIIDKICSQKAKADQIKKMQLFISEILDSNNEPQMKNIGQNLELKIKYIKLAHFLLHFQGFSGLDIDYKGISESLKKHLLRIIELRNLLVKNITEWIKYLLGDVYGFVFNLEGVKIDQDFANSLPVEYPSIVEKTIYKEVSVENQNTEVILNFIFNIF